MAKILFVRSTPYNEDLNGYNVQGVGIAIAFCKQGHDCDYLNYHTSEEKVIDLLYDNGHKARVIYKKRIRIFRTGICFDALNQEFLSQYDIVICREYNQLMTHLIAKRHKNTSMYSGPYWNMFMIPAVSFLYDALYTKKMNNELRCKFVKSELAKDFLEKKGYSELIDVGVGLDTTRFENVSCNDNTKKIVDYMNQHRCILYIGTLNSNKNLPFILKLFEKILTIRKDVKLILIGKSEQTLVNKIIGRKNETYYEDLLKQIPDDVREAIWHIERVDNPQLQFIYPLAKVFLLPSLLEIFGMVMLEAMYFGAPVITSRNGGSSTLIRNDEYGQVIEDYDLDKWSSGIVRYLDDKDYTNKVIGKCKSLIRSDYTWESITKNMYSYICEK